MKKIPVRHIADNQPEPEASGRFSIRSVGDLLGGNDLVQELHRHDFFLLLALEHGLGAHEIDFIPYPVSNRSIFFIRPGQVHQLSLKSGCTGFLTAFSPAFYHPAGSTAGQRLRKASHNTLCLPDASRFRSIHGLLSRLFREYTERQEGYQDAIRSGLDLMMIELVRQSSHTGSRPTAAGQYAQARLEEFMDLLAMHITRLKQVAQYADLLHISPYQLNTITRTNVGKPASALINDHIILEAKRHLLAAPDQVKEIAWDLGYEDVSYFIRFFRKHTGHTPEAFRQKHG